MKRRRSLLTIAGLGSVVTLLGLAGLIAPFTDRATTGANSIESGARAKEVDLQLASFEQNPTPQPCGSFSDDLTTGLLSASNVQPNQISGPTEATGVCVKNVGSSTVSVGFTALDLSDVDTECTGDEPAVDASCGNGGAGELSPQLNVGFAVKECVTGVPSSSVAQRLSVLTTTPPVALVVLVPGQVACLGPSWRYDPVAGDLDGTTEAQTDQATWRFAFDGAQATTP